MNKNKMNYQNDWIKQNRKRVTIFLTNEKAEEVDAAIQKYNFKSKNDFLNNAVNNFLKMLYKSDSE